MSRPARVGPETPRGRCEMSSISPHETVTTAERGREFWRAALLAGAFTALPRWTREPVAGIGEHEARIPDELVAALRRLADPLAVPLSSVWLTAQAQVLSALSGERGVWTGYGVMGGRPPFISRLTAGRPSGR